MADSDNDKQRIAAALSASRTELKSFFFQLRRSLDIRPYLSESRKKHVWGWMSAAAIFGWILSGLPARKEKIYIHSSDPRKAEKKLGWDGTSDTRLGGGMVHCKAGSGRLSDEEDQEDRSKGEAPGRKRSLRSDQMGDRIFKRD